jgi:protein-S-isoprenylcysteine O-methyltransferase Ste14
MEGKVKSSRRSQMTWKDFITASIYSPLIVIQFVLTFFFYQNYYGYDLMMYGGIGVWILSAILGIAPIIIFRRRGGVPKGKGYVHTTKLVTDGLYGVVRHPQYTAGLLLILAMMMISQHWLVLLAGVIAFAVFYYDIIREDRHLVRIFGKAYRRYMRRVPRTNFAWGLIKVARRRRRRSRAAS